jgi:hypothetical protein
VSNKKLDDEFIRLFNNANVFGLNSMDKVVEENPVTIFDLYHYYRDCISFYLDENKLKGLKLFLQKIRK